MLTLLLAAAALAADWPSTIEAVVPAIVNLEVNRTRGFDTSNAGSTYGTGFIVDAEGLILTNRHLTPPGPIVARAILASREEVSLEVVYRDPVHDFGIYRFDPAAVTFHDLTAIPLAPGGAQVGVDIRVIGNDSGDKLSILDSTIARIDRNAPNYGKGRYTAHQSSVFRVGSDDLRDVAACRPEAR